MFRSPSNYFSAALLLLFMLTEQNITNIKCNYFLNIANVNKLAEMYPKTEETALVIIPPAHNAANKKQLQENTEFVSKILTEIL